MVLGTSSSKAISCTPERRSGCGKEQSDEQTTKALFGEIPGREAEVNDAKPGASPCEWEGLG